MAEFVVVLFEIVDVEQQQRDAEALGAGPLDEAFHEFREIAAVIGAGQLIGDGQRAQLLLPAGHGHPRGQPAGGLVQLRRQRRIRAFRVQRAKAHAFMGHRGAHGAVRGLLRLGPARLQRTISTSKGILIPGCTL